MSAQELQSLLAAAKKEVARLRATLAKGAVCTQCGAVTASRTSVGTSDGEEGEWEGEEGYGAVADDGSSTVSGPGSPRDDGGAGRGGGDGEDRGRLLSRIAQLEAEVEAERVRYGISANMSDRIEMRCLTHIVVCIFLIGATFLYYIAT